MKRKSKYNNPYKIPNEKANEIYGLSNEELVKRTNIEYKNWLAAQKQKKDDPQIATVKEQIKELQESEIKGDTEYQELAAKLEEMKFNLTSEDLARFKEELKNLTDPYNEDIKSFKSMFQLAMDEISRRREAKIL